MKTLILKFCFFGMIFGALFAANLPPAKGLSRSDRSEWGILLAATGEKEEAIMLFDLALELAEAIEEKEEKIETLAYIADRLVVSGFRDRAENLFDRAVALSKQKSDDFYSHYYEDRALRKVAVQMAQAGYRDRALKEANHITSPLARAEVLNAVATAFIEANELEQARMLLLEAVQLAKTETESLSYEANGSCENLQYALFVKIADNFSKISELESALNLAESVRGCYSASNMGSPFQRYQAQAYLSILYNLKTIETLQEIWKSARGMVDSFEAVTVWGAIASKSLHIEEYDFAISIARELADPNRFNLDEIGVDREQFSWLQRTSLVGISLGFVGQGKFQQARNLLQFPSKPPPVEMRFLIEVEIAREIHQQGRTEEAIEMLLDLSSQYSDEIATIPDEKLSLEQLQISIVHTLALIGAEEKAMQMINSLTDSSLQELTLINLIFIFASQGEISKALQILSDLKDISEFFLWSTLRAIVPMVTELEYLEEVLKIIEARKLLIEEIQEEIQEKIGLQFLKLGESERGYDLMNSIQGENLEPKTVEEASSQLIQQGETSKALSLIQKIEVSAIAARTLANLGTEIAVK